MIVVIVSRFKLMDFKGKYNLIRGNFIEMMVQHYIDLIFLQLGLKNVYAFTLGFVVLKKGEETVLVQPQIFLLLLRKATLHH